MRGHEAYALYAVYLIYLLKELREACLSAERAAFRAVRNACVGVDVLPQQHYFFGSGCSKAFYLFEHPFRRPAALSAPGIRHYAVGAEVVAALHDAYVSLERVFSLCGEPFSYGLAVLPDLHDILVLFGHVPEKLWKLMQIVSSEDQIHPGIFGFELVYVYLLLHHAPADADYPSRVLFVRVLELPQHPVKALVSVLPHGTRVEHANIRLLELRTVFITHILEHPGERLRIPLVHLAAECNYVIGFFHVFFFI